MRLPTARAELRATSSPSSLSDASLRLLARQHAFGGFGVFADAAHADGWAAPACTRHHVVDWNYVGAARPVPNKWLLEPREDGGGGGGGGGAVDQWKEWSFARDERGQSFYMEQWDRLEGGGPAPVLALRAEAGARRDALLVVVGDHFALVRGRPADVVAAVRGLGAPPGSIRSCADAVDAALERGERKLAEALVVSLEAAHGSRSAGWIVADSLQPWLEGRTLAELLGGAPTVTPADGVPISARWADDAVFDVVESSAEGAEELGALLR